MIVPLCDPIKPIYWAHSAWKNDRLIERALKEKPEWYEEILSNLIEDKDGCLIWRKGLSHGYGQAALPHSITHVDNGSMPVKVHRVRWLAERGPLALGWIPDHLCKVISCGNIKHLEAVPVEINTMRGEWFIVQKTRMVICQAGHDLADPANWKPSDAKRGRRGCYTCHLENKHVISVLRGEANRRTGMTQRQFMAVHGSSLQAFIDAVGGYDEAIATVRMKARPEAVKVTALGSGGWADFAKSVMRNT